MSMNGIGISMAAIPVVHKIIQRGQIAGLTVWRAAVAGTTMPSAAPFPVGAAAMRPTATTAWASAFVGFPLDFCFLFFLPFAKFEEKQESFTLRTQWGCRGIVPPAVFDFFNKDIHV